MNRAIASTVFAIKDGKVYTLTVQRANTKKWNRQIMFGAGETIRDKETAKQALFRGLKEELGVEQGQVKKVIWIGKAKAREEAHLGYAGYFSLVEVPFEILQATKERVNKRPVSHELEKARISRPWRLGIRPKKLQPHYRDMLAMIKHRLGKEAVERRRVR